MKAYIDRSVMHWRDTLGFALFLTWVYCALFGCGLSTHHEALTGTPASYGLERMWMVSALFEALGGLAGIAAARFLPDPDRVLKRAGLFVAAAVCAAAGSLLFWVAWLDPASLFEGFYLAGSALTGIGMALCTVVWGSRLRERNEAHLEFAIPFSFTVSFLAYFLILLTKQNTGVVLVLLMAVGSASMLLAWSGRGEVPARPAPPPVADARSGMWSFCALMVASWVQVAFFRVISTPAVQGDRFTHYLIPFSLACAFSLCMLLLCIRLSRYLNITLAYRWSLPFFVLSYVPIIVDYGNADLRMIAYGINFLGMFGLQFGCWIGACKYLRRTNGSSLDLFSLFAVGEGTGIFAGCLIGLSTVRAFDVQGIIAVALSIMSVCVFVTMATGFNPNWLFHRTRSTQQPSYQDDAADLAAETETIDAIFQKQASALQRRYGLTERETDVAALLLAGRSRPFIRDELTVSINTVSSHVRSIFSKCEVHSQQELIDLARSGAAPSGDQPAPSPAS